MSAHTPGPWSLDLLPDGEFYVHVPPIVDMGTNTAIARRGPWTHRAAESYANARLIAAAPELLAALQALLADAETVRRVMLAEVGCGMVDEVAVSNAERAIAKATGAAQ